MTPRQPGEPGGLAQERLQILRMVEDRTITPEDGFRLLDALERTDRPRQPTPVVKGPRDVRIRITSRRTGNKEVDLVMPLAWVKSGIGIANRLAPGRLPDVSNVLHSVEDGYVGHLIDIDNEEDRVEIVVEARR